MTTNGGFNRQIRHPIKWTAYQINAESKVADYALSFHRIGASKPKRFKVRSFAQVSTAF
jgi:hypothetical protein